MSTDDPVNQQILADYYRHPDRWEHKPCAREHLPGQVCVLADGHPEPASGWRDDYQDIEQVEVAIGQQDPVVVGGFTIRSGVLPVGDHEAQRHYPTLIFDFTLNRGTKLQPIVLVMDEDDLEPVGRLIGNAAHGAITAARKAEGRDPRTGRRTS